MSYLPEEEIQGKGGINLAPMIDFLFLMLAFFASLAVSRVATKEMDIDLVKIEEKNGATVQRGETDRKVIHVSISPSGQYLWSTDLHDYEMSSTEEITKELESQYQRGLLPHSRDKTSLLLKIDRSAPWEPIARLVYEVRTKGFDIRPIYQVDESTSQNELAENSEIPKKNSF